MRLLLNKKYFFLKPIVKKNLIRIGNKSDGGYVIDKSCLKRANSLISFGVGDDWSFEEQCLKINNKINIKIYDHTVDISFFFNNFFRRLRRFLTFRNKLSSLTSTFKILENYLKLKKFVNKNNLEYFPYKVTNVKFSKNEIDIDKIISKDDQKIILKCDIEGDEYKIIDKILKFSKKIEMIIIEFHWPEKNFKKFKKIINKLKKEYDIFHLHINNNSNYIKSKLPDFIEFTFLKKHRINKYKHRKYLPIKNFDYPNNPAIDDFEIYFK